MGDRSIRPLVGARTAEQAGSIRADAEAVAFAPAEPVVTARPDRPAALGRLAASIPPLVVVGLALLAGAPLFQGRMMSGHDALEHLSRTAEYARGWAAGVWWPQWAPNLGHGYGEPIFLFNPPLFYALAALPVVAGLPVVWGVNLASAALLVLAGLGTYVWTRLHFERPAALVAAVAYLWAPYTMLDLYVRQALTELAAVCLFPWAMWALARLCLAPHPRRLAVAGVAVALLLLGSTPATVVIAPALLGQILLLAVWRRPRGAACGVAALLLAVVLAAAFWVPASTERHLLRFDRLLTGQLGYYNHFLEPQQLWSSYWGYGSSRPGPDDRKGFGLGEAQLLLVACGLGLLLLGRARERTAPRPVSVRRADADRRLGMSRQLWLAVGLIGLGAAMSTELSRPLWDRSPELQHLQFPWRFLMLPALGCAVLAAAPAAFVAGRWPRAGLVVAAACVAILVAGSWTRAGPRELVRAPEELFAPTAVASRDRDEGTAYEYETVWTRSRPDRPPAARLAVLSGAVDITELAGAPHRQQFALAVREPARLRLNTFYFPGWRVLVDGRERAVDYGNRSGLIELTVEPGEQHLEARFEPTGPRLVGAGLSIAGLAVSGLLLAWPRRRLASADRLS